MGDNSYDDLKRDANRLANAGCGAFVLVLTLFVAFGLTVTVANALGWPWWAFVLAVLGLFLLVCGAIVVLDEILP